MKNFLLKTTLVFVASLLSVSALADEQFLECWTSDQPRRMVAVVSLTDGIKDESDYRTETYAFGTIYLYGDNAISKISVENVGDKGSLKREMVLHEFGGLTARSLHYTFKNYKGEDIKINVGHSYWIAGTYYPNHMMSQIPPYKDLECH